MSVGLAACGGGEGVPRLAGVVTAPEAAAGSGAGLGDGKGIDLAHLWIGEPRPIGPLVGANAQLAPAGVRVSGSDLGWTFAHRGRLIALFGDTVPYPNFYCDAPPPFEDDTVGSLPAVYAGGVPRLEFVTRGAGSSDAAWLRVIKRGAPLSMGAFKTPLTGWSDGEHVFALFGRVESSRCSEDCEASGLSCAETLGTCEGSARSCNTAAADSGCGSRKCVPADPGFCIDPTAATYTGSGSEAASIARDTELGMQRESEPATFDSVFTLRSKKFHNPTARTVRAFGYGLAGNDYAPGYGQLFLWGRPGFSTPRGRGQLYLLTHALPLSVQGGALDWRPQYFAGVDPTSNAPRWSEDPRESLPIALDGNVNGDPTEEVGLVEQMAISWLGPPLRKWIMLYAGGPDSGMRESGTPSSPRAGAILMRFADQPWGPWSAARVHMSPGDASLSGSASGPGGILYNAACSDRPGRSCARSDQIRALDTTSGDCTTSRAQRDMGYFYGANVIDAYTRGSAQQLTMYWNVSTWNPYGVTLLATEFEVR
ncbi:MAG TPA: hypothetical protein VJV78_47550 [Polyangiales bacterium]|nr:hypothetical protein [Polyangiales bacterium]